MNKVGSGAFGMGRIGRHRSVVGQQSEGVTALLMLRLRAASKAGRTFG